MKVTQVAELSEGKIYLQNSKLANEFTSIITSTATVAKSSGRSFWEVHVAVERGPGAREVVLRLGPLLSEDGYARSKREPLFIGQKNLRVIFFRDRLFLSERDINTSQEKEEAFLRVKKMAYDSEKEIEALKEYVTNIEAAIDYSQGKIARQPIPNDVKLFVWARDGGKCVNCGATKDLQFDHIIPLARGGANTKENIQILCRACNSRKSDEIWG